MEKKSPELDSSPPISFRPITEGLGFHPFSNGLPYAPIGKTPKVSSPSIPSSLALKGLGTPSVQRPNQGAGALAAGAPRFIPQVPRVSKPEPVPTPMPPAPSPWVPGWGYLLRRAFAYGLDVTLNATLFLAVLSQTVWKGNFKFSYLADPNVILVAGIFFLLLNWAIITVTEMVFGATPGKKIFGLTLRGSALALFLRAFFFIPSAAFFGIGLIWGLVDPRKCCWHDRLLDIQPVDTD